MRRFDKNKNMKKANILSEYRYLKDKSLLSEEPGDISFSDELMIQNDNAKKDNIIIKRDSLGYSIFMNFHYLARDGHGTKEDDFDLMDVEQTLISAVDTAKILAKQYRVDAYIVDNGGNKEQIFSIQ
tara:strand:+ start:115602 stop:115982 length:381 start_codon:yes stop_codon:yes gene_type:complete